jgi:DNA-binding SARP family transcriptional activator
MAAVTVGILGPLHVSVADRPVVIAGPKQRSLVAMLALHANHPVSVGALVDAVWGDPAPDGAEHTLQQHVSAVRKLLEPGRGAATAATILLTRSPGYELRVESLDADEFERLATAGFAAAGAARWPDALEALGAALACWRGPALADVRDSPKLGAAAVRLDEQRLTVLEARFDARLESGQAGEVVAEIEQLVVEYPFRERLRGQLMLALYRSGRQADALAAYRAARQVLVDELGIEPGAALRDLEQAILMQSTELDAGASSPIGELYATFRSDARPDVARVELPDGQAVLLGVGTTLIGRDAAAQVRLVDNRVSRHHAYIDTVAGVCTLRDAGSTNGTSVNGTPVSEHSLLDGDVISIGGVELRFRGTGSE